MKEKIIIFGIGYYYRVYFNFLTEMYDIICLTDNSEEKQNKIECLTEEIKELYKSLL